MRGMGESMETAVTGSEAHQESEFCGYSESTPCFS